MSRRAPATAPTYAEHVGQVTGLMNALAEARLERVTRTARRLYNVQSAVILLWRGSRLVYQVPHGAWLEASPELVALGQAAARVGAPRVICDAGLTVEATGSHRFIAIVPLAVDRGLSGGCLCLLDEHPRDFSGEDLQSLGDLATWAEHELDVVRLGQALALRTA
jgi:hypothetical protein